MVAVYLDDTPDSITLARKEIYEQCVQVSLDSLLTLLKVVSLFTPKIGALFNGRND